MVWRLPLIRKTLKSLALSSQRTQIRTENPEESYQRHEVVKDLARQRLDRADMLSLDTRYLRQLN